MAFVKGQISPRKGVKLSQETKAKIAIGHLGKKLSFEHREKVIKTLIGKYRFKKGQKNPKEWYIGRVSKFKGISRSKEVKDKISATKRGKKPSIETRKKMAIAHSGEKCPFWRGGIHKKNSSIRESFEYKLWRESVFKRDNYTCVWCGQIGGKLHVDHIKPFSLFPELRLALDNGRTLCIPCHKTTDTWASKAKNYKLI